MPATRCIVCENTDIDYFKETTNIVKCKNCLSVYSIEPFQDNVNYTDDSTKVTTFEKFYAKIVHHFVQNMTSNEYIDFLKTKTSMDFKNALDIGAAYGTFVRDLNKLGIDTEGIESNKRQIELAATNKIKHANFDLNFKSDKKYDLICMALLIHFLRDNKRVLKIVHDMLNKDGFLFITNPNPDSSLVTKELIAPNPAVMNMVLGKKFWESIKDTIGFELVDFTVYRSNISLSMHPSKNKKLELIKYWLGLKKGVVKDPDGNVAFILLKKLN